mmetsp:Transcript_104849/g.144997  ORF Transcript_104849/g.144997 Transcript_104849/m.144997 type:complete len:102 (-) Transcript_104849:28-333(-)
MLGTILKDEGGVVSGLFKGYSAAFYGAMVAGGIYFTAYKAFKEWTRSLLFKSQKDGRELSPGRQALMFSFASMLAEISSLVVYFPFEVLKLRYITKNTLEA